MRRAALRRGLNLGTASGSALTRVPPLTISAGELDVALEILRDSLAAVARGDP